MTMSFFFCALKGVDLHEAKIRLGNYAKLLNFTDFLQRKVESLSTGEMKKASILCGLCTNTEIILLDEPSSGLDIDAVVELKSCLYNIVSELKSTLIISSHDVDFLSSVTSKFLFLIEGRNVLQIDSAMSSEEIRAKYFKLREKGGTFRDEEGAYSNRA